MEAAIVDINNQNVKRLWPYIENSIKTATFIAIDCELTGLGPKGKLNLRDIQDRYLHLKTVAESHALLSLGLSCFREQEEDHSYDIHIFDIKLLCNEPYLVDPAALKFLTQHGFDFNKQVREGLPYTIHKGPKKSEKFSANAIFDLLHQFNKTLIVHNGLIDLMFMYHHLYAPLPSSLDLFVADLTDMFDLIIDSKCLADFQVREPASYLEYLFRKCFRVADRPRGPRKTVVKIQFSNYAKLRDVGRLPPFIDMVRLPRSTHSALQEGVEICERYANHGFCHQASSCEKSHNIDLILDVEEASRRKRRKVDKDSESSGAETKKIEEDGEDEPLQQLPAARSQGHRAGFDSFMTGYIICAYRLLHGKGIIEKGGKCLYLSGKPRPLKLITSQYTSLSSHHKTKKDLSKIESTAS